MIDLRVMYYGGKGSCAKTNTTSATTVMNYADGCHYCCMLYYDVPQRNAGPSWVTLYNKT